MDKSLAFGVCLNSVTRWGPLVQTVLYLQDSFYMRLALKLFRREPAISKFDWNFSATHTSSPHFSTFPHGTGSLSVTREYLALGDGPPCFRRDFSCPAVLRIHSGGNEVSTTGFLPSSTDLSRSLHLPRSFVTPC